MDHCQCWRKFCHRIFSIHSLRCRHVEVPVGQLPSKATSDHDNDDIEADMSSLSRSEEGDDRSGEFWLQKWCSQ